MNISPEDWNQSNHEPEEDGLQGVLLVLVGHSALLGLVAGIP
jgi:hypothetical protein